MLISSFKGAEWAAHKVAVPSYHVQSFFKLCRCSSLGLFHTTSSLHKTYQPLSFRCVLSHAGHERKPNLIIYTCFKILVLKDLIDLGKIFLPQQSGVLGYLLTYLFKIVTLVYLISR